MELKTRCPRCSTTFAASVELLQRRRGYIRCIQCAHIFDGFEEVIDEGEPEPTYRAPSQAPEPSVKIEPVLAQNRPPAAQQVDLQAPVPGPRFVEHSRHAPPRDEGSAHDSLQVRKFPDSVLANAPVAPPQPSTQADRSDSDGHEQLPFFVSGHLPVQSSEHHIGAASWGESDPDFSVGDRAQTLRAAYPSRQADGTARADVEQDWTIPANPALQRETRYEGEAGTGQRIWSFFWKLLCVLGIVVLLGQLVYVYRVQIASHVPVLRPVLERACLELGCQVPFERRIDAIRIVSSALHKEPGEGSRSMLRFTLRNEFERPQQWPTLVLDLKDFSGALIARRNLAPEQYLVPGLRHLPFGARAELAVQLPLDTGGLQVNGYEISPFFP
ncbi:zinc-ribbon and DUF3426 domain-containing protein [Alcaligenes sp. SDU_A2]|uniref:zinc-ribbon and DUF3426 domain-containing protein n=1 Tax=Alcaligenes sp. SDU_A2 TaxID=3136634 RepID=UPI00311F1D68